MTNPTRNRIFDEVAGSIDIPESAYETAKRRYEDIGRWFARTEAESNKFDPHIYPQGSFRLGTVIRPVNEDGEYDLDLGCRLRSGITKADYTQKYLKELVGRDLEAYRVARQVEQDLDEKPRCWRLHYADEISFHIDSVPSIPETEETRRVILNSIRNRAGDLLARSITDHTGAITDNRDDNYEIISSNWRISNSIGYALWFESRMKIAEELLREILIRNRAAKLDDLPVYRWKSPLQRCVQILKRHRDIMYADNPESQPISVIITTLAGEAYQGEREIADAMERILTDMGGLVQPTKPRVPNPVNPAEDFADKWYNPAYAHLKLEDNFKRWLKQAQIDFAAIGNARNADYLNDLVNAKLGTTLTKDGLDERLGFSGTVAAAGGKQHIITGSPARPWAIY